MNQIFNPTSALRVLYLEKDPSSAIKFNETFGDAYAIYSFNNIEAAVSWLKEEDEQLDLLIINDNIGGFDVVQEVRKLAKSPNLPVVVLTDHLTQSALETAYHNRVNDIYPVDVDEDQLRTRLKFLEKRKAYQSKQPIKNPEKPFHSVTPLWKRLLDITVSFSVLLMLSPILIVVIILIKLDSPGPIFYSSKRVGAGYRVFGMYKFRSMRQNADSMLSTMASKNLYGSSKLDFDPAFICESCRELGIPCQRLLFTEDKTVCETEYLEAKRQTAKFMKFRDDPRITRLGTFLRNSSIDEIPQLFNILRGDMSLVGNRPLPVYEAEKLTTNEFAQRFAGPAGLTGLWQVKKRGKGQPRMSDKERILLDIEYAETFSFATDFQIILKTVVALWQKENV